MDVSVPPKVARGKSRAAAQKALELDNALAEAHIAMAAVHDGDWNWRDAETEYKRGIELNPNSALAHHWYGDDLVALGHAEAGIREIRKAVDLDPLSTALRTNLAWHLYLTRQYEQSLVEARHVLEVDPKSSFAHEVCGSDYEQQGRYDEAMAEWRQSLTLDGDTQLAARMTEAHELPRHREARRRRHGSGLQGRGHGARPLCRSQVSTRRCGPRPAGARALSAGSASRLCPESSPISALSTRSASTDSLQSFDQIEVSGVSRTGSSQRAGSPIDPPA
jgi:tetratricopeptide (TPR) repeat protein